MKEIFATQEPKSKPLVDPGRYYHKIITQQ